MKMTRNYLLLILLQIISTTIASYFAIATFVLPFRMTFVLDPSPIISLTFASECVVTTIFYIPFLFMIKTYIIGIWHLKRKKAKFYWYIGIGIMLFIIFFLTLAFVNYTTIGFNLLDFTLDFLSYFIKTFFGLKYTIPAPG